jgi:hypothetical protein
MTNNTPSKAAQYCAEEILLAAHVSIGEALQILLNFIAEARTSEASRIFAEEIISCVCTQIEPEQAIAH